ncbi:MAG: DUF1045 domain-containing protein [Bradyrhizobium sp.]
MASYPRYAVYYAPEPGSVLDCFGSELLGYDAHRGVDMPFSPGTALPPDWHAITQDPRKYGFHATLKAPMALAPDYHETELAAACEAFAAAPRPIPLVNPVVDTIEGFIAIVPAARCPDLQNLAAGCVREFDRFRAPLTDDDRARRNPWSLTRRQRDYLDAWGYPYVFEEFRFHMTLTGRLNAERQPLLLHPLRDRFQASGLNDLTIDRIVLFRQDGADRRFRIIGGWPLRRAKP